MGEEELFHAKDLILTTEYKESELDKFLAGKICPMLEGRCIKGDCLAFKEVLYFMDDLKFSDKTLKLEHALVANMAKYSCNLLSWSIECKLDKKIVVWQED